MAKFLSTSRDIPAVSLAQLYPNNTNMDRLLSVAQDSAEGLSSDDIPVRAIYGSATAIDTSNYNDFPIGSTILDMKGATKKQYGKSGASTWVSTTLS